MIMKACRLSAGEPAVASSRPVGASPPAPTGLDRMGLRPTDRVLVVGAYGVRNVGDEAILGGLLAQLEPRARVCVVSRSPTETSALHRVRAVSPAVALPTLLQTDALVIGGGGLFSSHMGTMGRLIPLFGLLASIIRRPIAMHGIGVDPTAPTWNLQMLAWLACRSRFVSVRDADSADFVGSLGVQAAVTPDLAMAMPPAPPSRGRAILRSLQLAEDRPVVGLCLTAVEPRLRPFLPEVVPQLIDALPECQFCFVPMSQHPSVADHNDAILGHQIQARCPRLAVLDGLYHPADVLALFHHFDAAVCMRYHSFVFAARTGVPIIAIPYARKCRTWMRDHDVTEVELSSGGLLDAVSQALSRRNRAKRRRPS